MGRSVVQSKVYQYVSMMETLLTNDDVKLLMRTLMLNNQVRNARVLQETQRLERWQTERDSSLEKTRPSRR